MRTSLSEARPTASRSSVTGEAYVVRCGGSQFVSRDWLTEELRRYRASIAISALLTFDYSGSTPIEGRRHFKDTLDTERCKGVYFCWQVCPEACFEKREEVRKVEIAHSDRRIRRGACVVQHSTDALSFEDEGASRIEPATIRRFKLNLLCQRTVDAGPEGSQAEEQV